MSKSELRGLAQNLSPASRDLARLVNTSLTLFPQADLLAKCATQTLLPTGDIPINDQFRTGEPNYREFAYALVGLSGETQNFDGNGQYVRFQPGGGSNMLSMGQAGTAGGQSFGNGFAGMGVQPKMPDKQPAYNDKTPCYKSQIPDLNGPWSAPGIVQARSTFQSVKTARRPAPAKLATPLEPFLNPFGRKLEAAK
jgi:hypothetical protein